MCVLTGGSNFVSHRHQFYLQDDADYSRGAAPGVTSKMSPKTLTQIPAGSKFSLSPSFVPLQNSRRSLPMPSEPRRNYFVHQSLNLRHSRVYGYGLRKFKFISQEMESNISRLGTKFFLPALLFAEIGPLATASNLKNLRNCEIRPICAVKLIPERLADYSAFAALSIGRLDRGHTFPQGRDGSALRSYVHFQQYPSFLLSAFKRFNTLSHTVQGKILTYLEMC
ncbi:hypothetical protein B0H17DRAFT_468836 [Mycena rosella]|uniref:Uncharacterized protein n=1 Tax=Mycena rosella TaxID=1033263 RepID=A0AAD7FSA3_MYCRO|nr:hypothetical protein B0H17DRAFT_468836 [Mycena rosella]